MSQRMSPLAQNEIERRHITQSELILLNANWLLRNVCQVWKPVVTAAMSNAHAHVVKDLSLGTVAIWEKNRQLKMPTKCRKWLKFHLHGSRRKKNRVVEHTRKSRQKSNSCFQIGYRTVATCRAQIEICQSRNYCNSNRI